MLEYLDSFDRKLTLLINGWHSDWADSFMIFMSEKWVWFPLYGFLVFILFRSFSIKAFSIRLIGLVIGVALSDQTASTLLKPNVLRLRPCHEPNLQSILHLPHGCGGMYGFASSHSANAFFLAFFFFFIFRKTIPGMAFLLLWAGLVAWSRIYLGAHYMGDVCAGLMIGLFWSYFILKLINHRKLILD